MKLKSPLAFVVSSLLSLAITGSVLAGYCGLGTGGGGGSYCASSAPSIAAAAGMHTQSFCDAFAYADTTFIDYGSANTKTWNSGLWYEGQPPSSFYSISSGTLTILADTAVGDTYLTTERHDLSGGKVFTLPFYAEARLNCTDFCSFWFFSLNHAKGTTCSVGTPASCAGEIDVIETDPTLVHVAFSTLHSNTSSNGGIADTTTSCFGNGTPGTGSATMPNGSSTQNQTHLYQVLVLSGTIQFFVDGSQTCQVNTFTSTNQAMMLIIGANTGGVNGGANVGTAQTLASAVSVWQAP